MRMDLNTFFKELVEQYSIAEAVTEKYRIGRPHIYRGRQHSISSIAEDLFSALLHDMMISDFPEIKLFFMVDYPMNPDNTGSSMYPDIAIIAEYKQPVLVSYLDLKTDLGYKREYYKFFPVIREKVERLRNSDTTGTVTYPDKKPVLISKSLKWRTVVISECNISSKDLGLNKSQAELFKDYIVLYFLSGKQHPNSKCLDKIHLFEHRPFEQLINDLKRDIYDAMPQIKASETVAI